MTSRRLVTNSSGSKVPRNPNFLAALRTALNGFWFVLKSERNFRVHCLAVGLVTAAALWFSVTWVEAALLTFACALVLGAEMINTALERLVDLVSPEWHADARLAKDASAGMVLVMVVAASLCGLWIFGPYVL